MIGIVALALCGVIANCDTWAEIVDFGNSHASWLKRFLKLPNGIPSQDTFERVFAKINPAALSSCCVHWLRNVSDLIGLSHRAIDGKTLRGSGSSTLGPLHLVAWATEAKLTLGEVAVAGKSNEIKAIPELLELLDLKGTLVTIDASGCQKAIAKQIVDQGGNYLLAVKGNQEHLLEDIQATVAKALDGELAKHQVRTSTTTEATHGRKETRAYYTITNLDDIRDRKLWAGLTTVCMCWCECTVNGKTSEEVRSFIASGRTGAVVRLDPNWHGQQGAVQNPLAILPTRGPDDLSSGTFKDFVKITNQDASLRGLQDRGRTNAEGNSMPTTPISRVIQHLLAACGRDGDGLTDGELLTRFLNSRDDAALSALVRRHGPMVWGVCCRLLRSHHDAEDAFQATFLVLVQKAATLPDKATVGNWLYGVAHQTAVRMRAIAAKRGVRERQVTVMPEPATAEQYVWNDLHSVLDEELSRLPNKYRVLIVLCDLEGMTRKEVARHLGIPEGTAATRLAAARAMLAKRLTRRGVALSGVLLGAVLSQQSARASVPTIVVSSTIKAATLVAAGQAAWGVVSAQVAALTEGVLKAMVLSKFKNAAVALLVVFVLTVGAGAVISQTSAGEQPHKEKTVKKADDKEAVPSDKGEAKNTTRWEYKKLSHDDIKALEFKRRGTDTPEGGLNMLGDEGWELVAIEPPVRGSAPPFGDRPALYVFKRQKK